MVMEFVVVEESSEIVVGKWLRKIISSKKRSVVVFEMKIEVVI